MVPVLGPDTDALEAALARELLLLVHHHGDADSVGCAIALAAAFPGARISATDGLSAAGKVMAERLEVEIEARPPASWDGTVVVVDTSNPEHCAPLPECNSVVVIDHHQTAGEWPAGTLLIHEPEAKSTAEIVTRLIPELGIELTPQMALPLLAGVYADTGHFRHASSDSFAVAHTLAASGNKKGQVRISSRASSAAIEAGLNLAQLLEALADEQDGSAGGHPGAAGFQAQGDPDALLAMAQQGCVAQLKSLAEGA